jgi:hypothetical protein
VAAEHTQVITFQHKEVPVVLAVGVLVVKVADRAGSKAGMQAQPILVAAAAAELEPANLLVAAQAVLA